MGIEKKVVSIRLDEEIIVKLKKCAKEENRPLSNMIETVLKAYATRTEGRQKVGTIKFDELGRLTLPTEAVAQFGLRENNKLLITVVEASQRMLLCPTQEEPQPFESAQEISRFCDGMKLKPVGEWRCVRRMDDRRRVVLPKIMRALLGWSEETCLRVDSDDSALYLEAVEQR